MDTVARLKNVRLFASLTPDNLARLAEVAIRRSYPKGSLLCRQDDFGKTLYIIDSGEAVLRQTDLRGLERPVGYLREGDLVGDDALLLGDAYGSCVQATSDVQVVSIRKDDFDHLLEKHPQIQAQLKPRRLLRERLKAPNIPWLEPDEPPLLLRRRHWLSLASSLLTPLVVLLLFSAGLWLLSRVDVTRITVSALLLVSVLPAGMALWHIVDWRNDFYLVTGRRILHEEKVILFRENWEEAPLTKIQTIDITRDLIGTLLGFGKMQIRTASALGLMVLDNVPDPEGMQEVIFKRIAYLRSRMQQQEKEDIRRELARHISGNDEDSSLVILPLLPQEPTKKSSGLLASLGLKRPLLGLQYKQAEEIIWRQHWVYLIRRIYLALPLFLLTTSLIAWVGLSPWAGQYRGSLLLPLVISWIVVLLRLWWHVEDWRNDLYILTDRLIIDTEKKPLFLAEKRKQASLDMIQNVSLKKRGFLSSLLDYGDLLIETAGAAGGFTFDGVHRPEAVQREIFRRVEQYNEARQRREREQRRTELSSWFQAYHQMNQEGQPPASE